MPTQRATRAPFSTLTAHAALTTALALVVRGADAQPAAPFGGAVPAGARVRIALADSLRQAPLVPRQQVLIGTVAGLAGDTLVLTVPGTAGALRVARADLRALAVSRGVPGRLESALRQGASTALFSALAFVFFHTTDDADRPFNSAGQAAAVGGAVGLAGGALFGAVWPSERWRNLRLR